MNGLLDRLGPCEMTLLAAQPTERALLQDGGNEFSLAVGAASCWITVDSLSVHLSREQGRLVVQVFPLLEEDKDAIARMEVENSTPF